MKIRTSSLIENCALCVLLVVATGAGIGAYIGRQQGGTAYAYSGGNPLIQFMFSSLYLYFFFQLVKRRKEATELIRQEKSMATFWLWALASAVWSVSASFTIVHWLALFGTGIMGLYIAIRFEPREQLRLVAWCLAVGAIASLFAVLAFPQIGLAADGAWQGVFFPKNSLGRMMALGAFCFVLLAMERRHKRSIYAAMAVICATLVLFSQSIAGVVVLVFMMALLPFRKLLVTLGSRLLVPAFTFLCILAIPSIAWLAENSTTILHFLGRDTNLTGRLPLWSVVMQEISSRPFFGFGYGAFWTTGEADQVRAAIGWNPPNAHNGFLEILLGVGLVGGAFFLFGLIRNLSLALRAARVGEDVSDSWPLFFLIFLLLYSITESSLLSANSILTVLFVANSYWVVRARFRVAETEEQESETEENYSAPESIGYAPLES